LETVDAGTSVPFGITQSRELFCIDASRCAVVWRKEFAHVMGPELVELFAAPRLVEVAVLLAAVLALNGVRALFR